MAHRLSVRFKSPSRFRRLHENNSGLEPYYVSCIRILGNLKNIKSTIVYYNRTKLLVLGQHC